MTTNHETDARQDEPSRGAWTTPSVRAADEVDAELHRLALAVRALGRVAGPTQAVNELSALVWSLLVEAQDLSPDQRRQAAEYLRDGMNLRSALLLPVIFVSRLGE